MVRWFHLAPIRWSNSGGRIGNFAKSMAFCQIIAMGFWQRWDDW